MKKNGLMLLALFVFGLGSFFASDAVGATGRIVGYWPLNEGRGKVVKAKVGDVNGGFVEVAGNEPTWVGKELLFKGGKKGGKVKIAGGGKLLSGPFFKISAEVKSNDAKGAGYILSSKAMSKKDGGFLIYYWADARKLFFNFADGLKKYQLVCQLKKRLPLNKWAKITVLYNGVLLTVAVNDKVVGSMPLKGVQLAPAGSLMVGGYLFNGQSFPGSIRNVKLEVPKLSDGLEGVFSVKNLGIPKIDGKLDDAVWKQANFFGDFVYFYKGKTASPQTEIAISAGKDRVYFAIRCFEPNISKLVAPKRHPGDMAFNDDLVEIFIDPDTSGDHYIHLALTAGNFQFQQVATHFGTRKRSDFNMTWDSAVNIGKNVWTAEIVIPYSELMVKPNNLGNWHINVGRANQTLDNNRIKWTTWGGLNPGEKNKGFHNINLFNTVTGFPKPVYKQKAKRRVAAKRKKWKLDEKPSGQSTAMLKIRDYMFVANNMVVPNWFVCLAPGKELMQSKTYHIVDLPKGIELLYVGRLPTKKQTGGGAAVYDVKVLKSVKHEGKPYNRYKVTPIKIHPRACLVVGPLYMRSSLADKTKSKIYFQSVSDIGTQKLESIALITRKFPTPGMPEKIITSLSWMHVKYSMAWPDFLTSYPKLGFNTVQTHRQFDKIIDFDKVKRFLNKARRAGLKIMQTENTFLSLSRAESRSIDPATGKPAKNRKDRCPAYRGDYYHEEIQKLVDFGRSINTDIYNLDIESFHHGAFQGKTGQCTRCQAYFKRSGKKPKEALVDMGTEIMADIKKALLVMSKEENRPAPYLGTYHTKPGGFVYSEIFDFDEMAKHGVDFAHPVRYASKNADDYGREMRKFRAMMKEGNIIPWLTAGYIVTNGSIEFPTEWVYNYVLETFGSGLRGTYWFDFTKFEGSDMYYFAKGMESVVPIADLIWDSKPVKGVTCNKASVSATALKSGDSYIILLSDYTKKPGFGSLTVTLPEAPVGKVWDLGHKKSGGRIDGNKVIINNFQPIEKNTDTAMYYVGTRKFK
jgi:concanavalin A-like lectin/glucanase superfamily protein/cellulose/xylan binding protein with CBM9 domain